MREKVVRVLERMRRGAYERDEALGLSLLSALAGESIFLLGLPGVGKSMIARRLKWAFKDATVFEYLMSRFSTPDEIFGPVSISRLKDEDCYERVTTGYLPEAEVVFLDEIWKAGPAIQNSLLTVLNEKVFLNGNREMKLPLKGVVAASNELPAKDEGLEALWDRFIIRYVVNPIEGRDNFFKLISGEGDEVDAQRGDCFTDEEYAAIREGSRGVALPETVMETIYRIRERMNAKLTERDPAIGETTEANRQYYVSDRRWRKAMEVIRTSAWLNGRGSVDFSDLLLLCHMLWNEEGGIETVRQIVTETIVSTLFRNVLDGYKSNKRHATPQKSESARLYSPDGRHYVIEVEGAPMKIAIIDYEKIMKSPADLFFGSETADSRIILRKQGQYVIRWAKSGHISINNFVYPLRTVSEGQLGSGFLNELGDSVGDIANGLYASINANLFLRGSDIPNSIQAVVGIYKARL